MKGLPVSRWSVALRRLFASPDPDPDPDPDATVGEAEAATAQASDVAASDVAANDVAASEAPDVPASPNTGWRRLRVPDVPALRLLTGTRPSALLVIAVLMASGVTAADLTRPVARTLVIAARALTPVVGSVAVCPEALATRQIDTRITAGAGGLGDVRIAAATLTADADEKVLTEIGSRVGQFDVDRTDPVAVVATASGGQAGGLAVEQVTRAETGPQHGLASVRCEPAVADSWYIGAATTINDRSELLLVNPYDDPATVDVVLYSRKGRLDVPGTTGVSVKGRSRVVRSLAQWAPDETWLAVHVLVRSGRVSPAARRTRSVKQVPSGVDWIPRSAAPAEVSSVGALPGGKGDRTLLIVNPGVDALTARVQVTRQDGQFVPADLAEIEVPGERVVSVPLTAILEGRSAMLEVSTDGPPALAGAYAEYTDAAVPGADFVYAAGMPALSGPALLTDNRVGPTADTALMFSAPEGAAEITLSQLPAAGSGASARTSLVPVRQGTLVVVALSRVFGRGDPLPVLVTTSANSAAVYATRVVVDKSARGPLVTALAVEGQPLAGVAVPGVVHDPAAWLLPVG